MSLEYTSVPRVSIGSDSRLWLHSPEGNTLKATGSDELVLTQQVKKKKGREKSTMNQAPHQYQEEDRQRVICITVLISQIVLLIVSQTKITDSMSFAILPLSHGAVSVVSLVFY